MASFLERLSQMLPMTYAYEALDRVTQGTGDAAGPATVVVGCAVLALAGGAATLRRTTG
jgi:ABC-2 type transport system permease protein